MEPNPDGSKHGPEPIRQLESELWSENQAERKETAHQAEVMNRNKKWCHRHVRCKQEVCERREASEVKVPTKADEEVKGDRTREQILFLVM